MITGKLIDVHAVVSDKGGIYGAFPTARQAEGYIREQVPESGAVIVAYRGFQPDDDARVLLFNQVGHSFYELSTDYEPEADRIRRELKQSAWAKLTVAERDAIGWSREP
jgi:hypothetical protein